jgi:hypothetical protein
MVNLISPECANAHFSAHDGEISSGIHETATQTGSRLNSLVSTWIRMDIIGGKNIVLAGTLLGAVAGSIDVPPMILQNFTGMPASQRSYCGLCPVI